MIIDHVFKVSQFHRNFLKLLVDANTEHNFIVLLEKRINNFLFVVVDAKQRTLFYNNYGVIEKHAISPRK